MKVKDYDVFIDLEELDTLKTEEYNLCVEIPLLHNNVQADNSIFISTNPDGELEFTWSVDGEYYELIVSNSEHKILSELYNRMI